MHNQKKTHIFPEKSYLRSENACHMDFEDDADDYENVTASELPPSVPTMETKGDTTSTWTKDLGLTRLDGPEKPHTVYTVFQPGIDIAPTIQPPPLGLDFSSSTMNASVRDEIGNVGGERKNTCGKVIPALVVLLIIILLTLSGLVGATFVHFSSFQKYAETEHRNLKANVTAINEALAKAQENIMTEMKTINGSLGTLCKLCPRGWHGVGSSCYYLSSSALSWEEACSECNKISSELVVMSSSSEMDALNKLLPATIRYWIGLKRDENNIQTWRWLDGTLLTFNSWDAGEPNDMNKNERCAEIVSARWNDLNCYMKANYICKKAWSC